MASNTRQVLAGLRIFVTAAFTALLLAGCGGGGGDGTGSTDKTLAPLVLEGTWQLTATSKGVTSDPLTVPASAVPSEALLSRLTAEDLAKVLAALFQGDTTSVDGSTITVTGPTTNYVLSITSFTTSDYAGCGTCGVGSQVSYTATVSFTEGGTLDGKAVPAGKGTLVVTFRYLRTA